MRNTKFTQTIYRDNFITQKTNSLKTPHTLYEAQEI